MIDDLKERIELYKGFVECETETARVLRNIDNENEARDYEETAENDKRIVALLTELQERREADRWIPIETEKDLPKESGFYLVTMEYRDSVSYKLRRVTTELFFSTIFQKWTECDSEDAEDGVIAWKPLPKPYESEAENEIR